MTRTPRAWLASNGHVSIPTVVEIATADTSETCEHGHLDCATVAGGDCSAEAAAYLWSRGIDPDAECWKPTPPDPADPALVADHAALCGCSRDLTRCPVSLAYIDRGPF